MAMQGDGPWAVAVMWAVVAVTLVFVVLRIYTRAVVVASYGIDDHVYNLAFIFLLCYTIFTTVSAEYGFGQNMFDIPVIDDLVKAVLFEAIGQTFAVVGMAVAKWSLGLFLLRLVNKIWHKVVIWIAMCSLMAASISVCFVFWLQCSPPAYLWDRRIDGGYCHINTTPVSFTLCILCVFVDFFFAIFPWIFVWNLNMNRREKLIITISMSLGVIAGACGIKRTIEVPSLSSANYLKDTVGLIVWSAAEIAVTMICIGIPVCRPLYKHYLDRLTSQNNSGGYKRHGGGEGGGGSSSHHAGPRYVLRTFGGSTMPGANEDTKWSSDERDEAAVATRGGGRRDNDGGDLEGGGAATSGAAAAAAAVDFEHMKLGIDGPFTETKAVGRAHSDNQSDEEILGDEYRQDRYKAPHPGRERPSGSIQVREEWRVVRS